MISSAVPIMLANKDKSLELHAPDGRQAGFGSGPRLLRIPPFPGARIREFTALGGGSADVAELVEEIRGLKVGGPYWAAQPEVPSGCVLVRRAAALEAAQQVALGKPVVLWAVDGAPAKRADGVKVISGDCDPWHMLSAAAAVVLEPDDEIRPIAALLDVPAYLHSIDGALTAESPSSCSPRS